MSVRGKDDTASLPEIRIVNVLIDKLAFLAEMSVREWWVGQLSVEYVLDAHLHGSSSLLALPPIEDQLVCLEAGQQVEHDTFYFIALLLVELQLRLGPSKTTSSSSVSCSATVRLSSSSSSS